MLAISTVWNVWRHPDAAAMAGELRELGFSSIELSFGMPLSLVEDIGGLVRKKEISVTSLHNYCPAPVLPEGMKLSPSALPLSHRDERLRRWAVRQTLRTVETAREGIDWNENPGIFPEHQQKDDSGGADRALGD